MARRPSKLRKPRGYEELELLASHHDDEAVEDDAPGSMADDGGLDSDGDV